MMRFEFRILDDDGEEIVSDYATISPEQIDQFGGCETVDMHTASALRFVRRKQRETVPA